MSTRKNCPKGYHFRKSFTRKFHANVINSGYTVRRKGKLYTVKPSNREVHINSRCVKGKHANQSNGSMRIGKLRKGDLIKYGYQYRLADRLRHKALEKAIKAYGALSVYHKLDAISKLTVHGAPSAHVIFTRDRDWVHEHHM